ncbi:MAG: hypothetical protein Q8N51_13095, partial [Gammaproteobacteria bacterium]|nr:hypothetical protein [Gammaproteobacteria bacterium]
MFSRKAMAVAVATAFVAPVQVLAQDTSTAAPAASSARAPIVTQSAFNPAISLILNGKYRNLEKEPDDYAIGGFVPAGGHGDEGHGHGAGPGEKGFGIDESELTISGNIDPYFSGYFTAAIIDEEVEVEEAFIQNTGYLPGATLKFGRFFSAFGYQNEQ